jgi:aryl-alcohol dehydrogenase-like predicted oxidoreductase
MQTRRLGRTGHYSTLAILGTAAFGNVSQQEADQAMEVAIAAGVNHIDVAPSYGDAEERLAPWMARERDRFFLGCKTTNRSKKNATEEFQQSLKRLGVDHFDLYQFHAVTRFDELDEIFTSGGALEAVLEARDAGLVKYIGITGHGINAPAIYLEALRRFDFDTVLFPLNFVLYANPAYRKNAEELLRQCRIKDVGTMVIKSIARGPWGDNPRLQATWYRPFTDLEHIQSAVNFALSQDITGLCTAGDVGVLPTFLQACEQFAPLSQPEQEALIATAGQYEPLFA